MGRWTRVLPLLFLLIVVPVIAQDSEAHENPSPLLIVEFQTGSSSSANDEFVELFNQTDELYPADELKLQYRSGTGTDWLTKASLQGALEPRGRYLIATSGLNIEANVINGLGLAAGGGHLRLVEMASDGEKVFDQVAWGSAQFALISPAPAPSTSQSLKRNVDEDGRFVDTDDDSQDFTVSDTPTPEYEPISETEELEPDSPPASGGTSDDEPDGPAPSQQTNNRSYARIEISELLPDPDKPLTDAEDEFVELYNPNAEAIDLEGYVIETGSKYSYDFTIPNITIKAKQYLAFYSLDTGLALSNSGGGARLLAPNKAPMYESPQYEKAKPDVSWANVGGVWQWSAKPTPNAPNQAASTAGASRSGSSSASGRSYLSQGRTLAATDDGRNVYEDPPVESDNQIDTAVVAGVGAMALLYAGNEYRYDIGNFIAKIKRYFASRRGGGATA